MARTSIDPLLLNIANSIGATVFTNWRGVTYVRRKAKSPRNPGSERQAQLRAMKIRADRNWWDGLDDDQRDDWNAYAARLASAAPPGNGNGGGGRQVIPQSRGIMSGFNAYIMAYCLVHSGEPLLTLPWTDDVPAVAPPNAPTNLVGRCRGGPPGNNLIWLTYTDPIGVPGGSPLYGFIRAWIVSTDAGVPRHMAWVAPVGPQFIAIALLRMHGQNILGLQHFPGHYLCQIDFVDKYGQRSTPSETVEVEITRSICPP